MFSQSSTDACLSDGTFGAGRANIDKKDRADELSLVILLLEVHAHRIGIDDRV